MAVGAYCSFGRHYINPNINYCRSLRLERSGSKQSQGWCEIASYRRNDKFSVYINHPHIQLTTIKFLSAISQF
ncbi:hypothetical protein [Dapis sp. BLCC M229]|uniref:hypothetical protein n=1 Tax=Dapis sp. BLCC M229 TaxID=3400188 RepID=UPI003CF0093D